MIRKSIEGQREVIKRSPFESYHEFAMRLSKGCMYSHRHFCFDKLILCTKWPNFTTPFYYVKVPKSKNELTHVHVGQKRPFTQKIRSLAQKRAILVF